MTIHTLQSARIRLRQWCDKDLPIFADLNSDMDTMEFFPSPLNMEASDALAEKCRSLITHRGWGLWAAEIKDTSEFIGFIGLHEVKQTLPFYPNVEIGWRLHKNYWGRGYASEAASEVLAFAFTTLRLEKVVSFTTVSNIRSRKVMERLGLVDSHLNFKHPDIPISHSLVDHVLYEITLQQWSSRQS